MNPEESQDIQKLLTSSVSDLLAEEEEEATQILTPEPEEEEEEEPEEFEEVDSDYYQEESIDYNIRSVEEANLEVAAQKKQITKLKSTLISTRKALEATRTENIDLGKRVSELEAVLVYKNDTRPSDTTVKFVSKTLASQLINLLNMLDIEIHFRKAQFPQSFQWIEIDQAYCPLCDLKFLPKDCIQITVCCHRWIHVRCFLKQRKELYCDLIGKNNSLIKEMNHGRVTSELSCRICESKVDPNFFVEYFLAKVDLRVEGFPPKRSKTSSDHSA